MSKKEPILLNLSSRDYKIMDANTLIWKIDVKPSSRDENGEKSEEDGEITENDESLKDRSKKRFRMRANKKRDLKKNENCLNKNNAAESYSKLSEEELVKQFNLVYQELKNCESKYQAQTNDQQSSFDPQFANRQQVSNYSNQQLSNNSPNFNNNNINHNKLPNQQFVNADGSELSMTEIKKMFNQLKKIVIANSRRKFNNNNRNKNFRNKKFDKNDNRDGKNKRKRRMNDDNSNKRIKNQIRSINNQPNQQMTFNPVITSDLFNVTNQFNQNQNIRSNQKRRKNLKQPTGQLCKFFFAGSCAKGSNCEFVHSNDKDLKLSELCKFYVQGK